MARRKALFSLSEGLHQKVSQLEGFGWNTCATSGGTCVLPVVEHVCYPWWNSCATNGVFEELDDPNPSNRSA